MTPFWRLHSNDAFKNATSLRGDMEKTVYAKKKPACAIKWQEQQSEENRRASGKERNRTSGVSTFLFVSGRPLERMATTKNLTPLEHFRVQLPDAKGSIALRTGSINLNIPGGCLGESFAASRFGCFRRTVIFHTKKHSAPDAEKTTNALDLTTKQHTVVLVSYAAASPRGGRKIWI